MVSALFVFLFQYWVSYCGSFVSLYKLYNCFLNTHKITNWDFDWSCIESIDQFGKDSHLDKLKMKYTTTLTLPDSH